MVLLGQKVRDTVTGFTGIATAKVEYINGCTQFAVTPPIDKEGKYTEGLYLDYQRLEFVDDGVSAIRSDTGGVMRDAPPASFRG